MVCIEVGEEYSSWKWQVCLATGWDKRIERRVCTPKAKKELGGPVIIMCNAINYLANVYQDYTLEEESTDYCLGSLTNH